ncbi:vWA domain-containing protein [Amycolatopsis magusensis]|uniref:vWA domain-containing protein n=1 Tax=Amycolatopsis magusensis TaxID=882444 RepID=UPI003C2BA306
MNRLVTAAAALLLALSSGPAAAQTGDSTRAEILASLSATQVPADYIVLLDTSGSMAGGNRYATAVASLSGLFDALPSEDHVALYTFDSTPNPEYRGPSRPAAELLGKLPSGPNPNGATDLGKAMAVALQELQRDGAARVANIVIITDGAHDPVASSPYADSTGSAWEALRQQGKQKASPTLSVYAVPLGDGTAGTATVKSVFDDAIVLTPGDVQNLREYLGRSKASVEMEKARTILTNDIGSSLEAHWRVEPGDNGNARVVVTLTSTAKHVPVDVSDIRLDAGALHVAIPSQQYRIEPGTSVDITGSLDIQQQDDMFMQRTVTEEVVVGLQATVRSSWTAALKPEIDLAVDRQFTSQSPPLALSRTIGSPLFLPAAALSILALAAAVMFLGRRRQGVLDGTLVVTTGLEPGELARITLAGRKTALDGLPGRGWVTPDGIWAKRGGLKISYTNSPDTRAPVTGRCADGGSLILGGLVFSHLKNGD